MPSCVPSCTPPGRAAATAHGSSGEGSYSIEIPEDTAQERWVALPLKREAAQNGTPCPAYPRAGQALKKCGRSTPRQPRNAVLLRYARAMHYDPI